MLVCYGFVLSPVERGRFYNHPSLYAGDIVSLKELFPNHPIWSSLTTAVGNCYHPTPEVARDFYQTLKHYPAPRELMQESFPAGNFFGRQPVSTTSRDAFDILIPFFEKELGIPAESQGS